ncbi:hypothetical protein [Tsukamurella hominis]|uniref:hypothetical protein n=1 Tax=Tsukamurella hominis TaxID=1970232 RepID=UPI0039E7B2D1
MTDAALRLENDELRRHAERLAASLLAILRDAHPTFPSTAKWHGGIGGSAITPHCSITQGSAPGTEWAELGLHEGPLRDFLRSRPDFDVQAAKNALIDEWKSQVSGDHLHASRPGGAARRSPQR